MIGQQPAALWQVASHLTATQLSATAFTPMEGTNRGLTQEEAAQMCLNAGGTPEPWTNTVIAPQEETELVGPTRRLLFSCYRQNMRKISKETCCNKVITEIKEQIKYQQGEQVNKLSGMEMKWFLKSSDQGPLLYNHQQIYFIVHKKSYVSLFGWGPAQWIGHYITPAHPAPAGGQSHYSNYRLELQCKLIDLIFCCILM